MPFNLMKGFRVCSMFIKSLQLKVWYILPKSYTCVLLQAEINLFNNYKQ
jgi:hypothetical protein